MKILGFFESSTAAEEYAQAHALGNYQVQHLGGKNADAPWALIVPPSRRSK